MNHVLSEPHNLDSIIQELQTWLYDYLIVQWNTQKLDAYGRVYKNEYEGEKIPMVYSSTKKNYTPVYYNNQSCFFFVDDNRHPWIDQDHEFTTSVKLCFMLNLDDLKTATERVDADVKRDVITFLAEKDYHFKGNGYLYGVDDVFKPEFDTDKIKHMDTHPFHVFAVELDFSYSVI
ncbi:hypothetical protein [Tenacibaculum sp.]|uniref:hypothetical protein n=1 Tax=Tenacibaculum sp. TaxID=1906242 RepID=UPI003D115E40